METPKIARHHHRLPLKWNEEEEIELPSQPEDADLESVYIEYGGASSSLAVEDWDEEAAEMLAELEEAEMLAELEEEAEMLAELEEEAEMLAQLEDVNLDYADTSHGRRPLPPAAGNMGKKVVRFDPVPRYKTIPHREAHTSTGTPLPPAAENKRKKAARPDPAPRPKSILRRKAPASTGTPPARATRRTDFTPLLFDIIYFDSVDFWQTSHRPAYRRSTPSKRRPLCTCDLVYVETYYGWT